MCIDKYEPIPMLNEFSIVEKPSMFSIVFSKVLSKTSRENFETRMSTLRGPVRTHLRKVDNRFGER